MTLIRLIVRSEFSCRRIVVMSVGPEEGRPTSITYVRFLPTYGKYQPTNESEFKLFARTDGSHGTFG